MKVTLSLCAIALIAPSAVAFAPSSSTFGVRTQTTTSLSMARPDSSEAVKHALEMSKTFGGTSKEAAAAWDIVEELDASDNSETTKPADDEARVSYGKNFGEKFSELADILKENEEKVSKIKALVSEIRDLKLTKPEMSSGPSKSSDAMKAAMAEAKEAVATHGATSTEAVLAWETVEEIASSGNSSVGAPDLDDECLIETMEACEALEEINRLATLQNFGGSSYSG